MKLALIVIAAALLAGCASLTDAGHASYKVTHTASGACDLEVADGKEFAEGRVMKFDGRACQFMAEESASKAFKGQAIAVKGLSILPTMGLGDILAPRDK
jgi:hypothetical protein